MSRTLSYVFPPEYHVFERDDKFLYFDPKNFVWFATNQVGKVILENLEKTNRADRIVKAIFDDLNPSQETPESVRAFIDNYLDQLERLGFLHQDSYREEAWHNGLMDRPYILYIHLTSKCNLKCPYCYNQEHRFQLLRDGASKNEGKLEDFLKLVDEAAALGFREVKLTGGEALLFKGALRIAERAHNLGLRVNLLTNAVLINDQIAQKIARTVDTISISLDSADPELHDMVRGKGTHAKVVSAIKTLRKNGVDWIHLNAVITPVTKDYVQEFLDFAWDELKADHVTLAGEAIAVDDPAERWGAKKYMLTDEEYLHLSQQEKEFYQKRHGERQQPTHRSALRRTQCGVGNGIVSVDANGDVYPCQTMHTEEMICGNVFREGLGHVLDHSPKLAQMKNLVVDILPECSTCPVRYVCAGGCRQEAYSREGDLLARNQAMCPTFFKNAVNRLWSAANLPVDRALQDEESFIPSEGCAV